MIKLSSRVANLIEIYNSDVRAAFNDGLKIEEAISIVGSITECMFRSIEKDKRELCWHVMKHLMDQRFLKGEL